MCAYCGGKISAVQDGGFERYKEMRQVLSEMTKSAAFFLKFS